MKSPLSFATVVLCSVIALAPAARAGAQDARADNQTTLQGVLVVPEPAALLLLGLGLTALAITVRARRRRRT